MGQTKSLKWMDSAGTQVPTGGMCPLGHSTWQRNATSSLISWTKMKAAGHTAWPLGLVWQFSILRVFMLYFQEAGNYHGEGARILKTPVDKPHLQPSYQTQHTHLSISSLWVLVSTPTDFPRSRNNIKKNIFKRCSLMISCSGVCRDTIPSVESFFIATPGI